MPEPRKLVAEGSHYVREQLRSTFGTQDDELNDVVVRLLAERKETLALAESCTGGYVASRITDVPGASTVLLGGFVTYSNEVKQEFLGVRAETLAEHGAVSEATAREMAEGACARLGADYALAITGIAGPSGGTEAKPVGTVFIALAAAHRTNVTVLRFTNRFDRPTFKQVTCAQALEILRRAVIRQ